MGEIVHKELVKIVEESLVMLPSMIVEEKLVILPTVVVLENSETIILETKNDE